MSFNDPNLQTIVHPVSFIPITNNHQRDRNTNTAVASPIEMLQEEQEQQSPTLPITVSIRDSFVAQPGYILLSADYSQIELRLMAHFSKDKSLMDTFWKEGGDVFQQIAMQWLNKVRLEDVSKQERERAKHICYGILYG